MSKKTLAVDMDELLDAISSGPSEDIRWYLDLRTGKVVPYMDSSVTGGDEMDELLEEEPERFEAVPEISSRRQYKHRRWFAEDLEEKDIAQQLLRALDGRGAVIERGPRLPRLLALLRQRLVALTQHGSDQPPEAGLLQRDDVLFLQREPLALGPKPLPLSGQLGPDLFQHSLEPAPLQQAFFQLQQPAVDLVGHTPTVADCLPPRQSGAGGATLAG